MNVHLTSVFIFLAVYKAKGSALIH